MEEAIDDYVLFGVVIVISLVVAAAFSSWSDRVTRQKGGRDPAHPDAKRISSPTTKSILRAAMYSIITLLALPVLFFLALKASFSSGDMLDSKGRVLRIRNRAHLPELATGDGWRSNDVVLETSLTSDERSVIGELWLLSARMEHASVAAFSQLSLHLSALGAPARLLSATHTAALEEIKHAEQCFEIARAITGVAHTAGPIAALDRGAGAAIDLTRLAIGSLVDGCLAEGIASDVAWLSASRAEDPVIRATLTMIAREEAGHAELAWDVLAWCLEQGDDAVHRAVATRVEALSKELTPQLPAITGVDEGTLARYGVIDQRSLGVIASERIIQVKERARGLLGQRERLAA